MGAALLIERTWRANDSPEGNNYGIYRVSGVQAGSPSVNLVYAALGNVDSLTFDPTQPQFLIFVESGNVKRMNIQTLVVEVLETGAPFFRLVRARDNGGFVAAAARDVYGVDNPPLIPPGGITPVLLGTNTNVGCCANTDLVVVGEDFTPFQVVVDAPAGGPATLQILNPPPGTTESWLFVSGTTIFPVGAGPFLGIVPDTLTLSVMTAFATPAPWNPIHSLGTPPSFTTLPLGYTSPLVGQTWDVVVLAIGGGTFAGRTNIERVTWQ